jgi:hypothetical protein
MHRHYPFFALALLVLFLNVSAVSALELKEVRSLASSGAVSLALQLIDEHQQTLNLVNDLNVWLEWESERIGIYEIGKRWQVLQNRVASYDMTLPENFNYWAKQKQIDALLKLKKGKQARNILQSLIWADREDSDEEKNLLIKWLPVWQKRVIQSYLVENNTADALLAAQRYYQDYQSNDIDDRLLRARILLMNQRDEEVVELLAKDTNHPQGGMLYLLAQLRSEVRPAQKVLQSALRQMRGKWAGEDLTFTLWAVVAEAAKQSGDHPSMVNALEFVLAGNRNIELPEGLFKFSADSLWNAYIEYALYLGNRAQYLIGDDKQWLDAAEEAKQKYPVKARSYYAFVMLRGQNEGARLKAAKGFLALMHKRKRGAELVKQLFLKSTYYKSLDEIPELIRNDLIDVALSRSDIELASNLMATIKEVPTDTDVYQWKLRRARIFILGGKADNGIQTLNEIIDSNNSFSKEQLDHFLQVVFDLQTVKEHDAAYQLFASIFPKVQEAGSQRELLFWMADSKKAQQNYTAAAQLYLRSAMFQQSGLDPWGQTARYQAAEMLTKADMLQDAHAIFEELLEVTEDPARRAVLKHELQKLWLLGNNNKVTDADY